MQVTLGSKLNPMILTNEFTNYLQKIAQHSIQSSFYDPTTLFLGDQVFDRDEFKRMRKEGLLTLDSENHLGKSYTLSEKAKSIIGLS